MQLSVGDTSYFTGGLAFPDQRHSAGAARAHVAIEAVHRRVKIAADEQLRFGWLPIEHLVPGFDPFQLLRPVRPVTSRGPPALFVRRGVVDMGACLEAFRWREAPRSEERRVGKECRS